MWHDLRQAVRTLAKHPGFVALAAAVLGLGIGLNVAIFSIVHAMLFKTWPATDSHELVSLYWVLPRQPDRPHVLPSAYIEEFRKYEHLFSGVAGHWGVSYALNADDQTDIVRAEWITSNYFDLLGVTPHLGRAFRPSEDDPANPARAVVISHQLWTRRFRADPSIVGRSIRLALSGRPEQVHTVVGVAPEEFKGIAPPWTPTQLWVTFEQSGSEVIARRRGYGAAGIARLRPGIDIQQARAVVATAGRQAYYSRPSASAEYEPRFLVMPTDSVRMPFDPSAVLIPARVAGALTIVVATVLLIAAANIAGILLARGVGRASEIAVRRVLGAGPLRIVRQLLTESVLLSVLGGALGLVLAAWLLDLFRTFTPSEFALDAGFEAGVIWFAVGLCVLAGVVVGVVPAVQAARANLLPWLATGGVAVRSGRQRARHAITVPQVALSLALLLVGSAYIRALIETETADLGYRTQNLAVASPVLRPDPGEDPTVTQGERAERHAARTRRFYAQLFERMRSIPGVADVALADGLPLREASYQPDWIIVSRERFLAGDRTGVAGDRRSVSAGFFRTMGIRMPVGRDFDDRDAYTNRKVVIVSTTLAQRLWPGGEAIGQQLTAVNGWNGFKGTVDWFEVVGIVEEVSPILHEKGSRPTVYFPLSQEWRPFVANLVARAHGDSRTLFPALKAAITGSDMFADVTRTTTMQQMVAWILYPRRIAGAVLSISGLVALFLAIIGIYGVVSYSVAHRTGEIGVRMALGAGRGDIVRLVLGDGMRIAVLGSAAGLILGYMSARATSNRYLSLPQLDVLTLIVTPLILVSVILLACYVPASRAGSTDPLTVLRRT
jgi:predicted permease